MNSRSRWMMCLRSERGINLGKVQLTERRARGQLVDWQVDRLNEFRDESLRLFDAGEVLASMWAGQAMWEVANGLNMALEEKRALRAGRKSVGRADDANRRKSLVASSKHAEWQKLANAKWAQKQHKDKSARAMADLIAKNGDNADTIRRAIKKLA